MSEWIHVFTPARDGKPIVVGAEDSISESGTLQAYLPATPKREAADDLYEALKGCVRIIEAYRRSVGLGKSQTERFEAAKAAIAKAEGRAE